MGTGTFGSAQRPGPGVVTGRVVHTADVVRDRRTVVGLVALGALVGLFTLVDSGSPLRAAVAMGLGLPLLAACIFLIGRSSRLANAGALGLLGLAIAFVPLAVGGRYPGRNGIGDAPGGVGLMVVGALIFLGFALVGWVAGRKADN
jgi:hypothetical protein